MGYVDISLYHALITHIICTQTRIMYINLYYVNTGADYMGVFSTFVTFIGLKSQPGVSVRVLEKRSCDYRIKISAHFYQAGQDFQWLILPHRERDLITWGIIMWSSARLLAHYVNDMPQAVDCNLLLYADDSCLVFRDNNINEVEKQLNKNLTLFVIGLLITIYAFTSEKTKQSLCFLAEEIKEPAVRNWTSEELTSRLSNTHQ